jgi:hypothetical protein
MIDHRPSQEVTPLSVVIATLGGNTLLTTIEQLNHGTLVPLEILICIPMQESSRIENLNFKNVRVIRTICRGQVAQRAIGFQQAAYEFVLQLDDDMFVDKHCVENLVNTMRSHGPKIAVGPAMVTMPSGVSCYRETGNVLLMKIYYWLINGSFGYEPGKITKAGTSPGIDPGLAQKEIVEVEWLAGGCLLHHRDNLILENFYPLKGKAYCEDLIHSFHLTSKGLKLIVCIDARCGLFETSSYPDVPFPPFLRSRLDDLKARKYFVQISGKSIFRMYIYFIIIILWDIRDRIKQFMLLRSIKKSN